MVWVPDPKNPKNKIWTKGQDVPGSEIRLPSARVHRGVGRVLPSARVHRGVGRVLPSACVHRGVGGVLPSPRGLSQLPSSSKGKERENTPPTPTWSPEPPELPQSSTSSNGKRAASPELDSLAYEGGSKIPISKRTAGARVARMDQRHDNHFHSNKVVILKLTGKGKGTHWTLVQQKQTSGGEFQSISDIDHIIPVVATTWLDWLKAIGKQQWGLSDETCNILHDLADLALSAGGVNINKHPNIRVVETRRDGNCGYHALEMIMQELPEDERMTTAQMRERISGLVTQLHFDLEKTEYAEEDLPEYLNGTLEKYQSAIREGSVWIDGFGIHNILEKCGLRAFIWSDCGDVKKMKQGVEKLRGMYYGVV